jgi:hypothetical protein
MSGLHKADVTGRMKGFLARKATPKHLATSDEAQAAEITALVFCALRYAPPDPDKLRGWWGDFEANLSSLCGGFWPTEKQIGEVARSIRETKTGDGGNLAELSPDARTKAEKIIANARRWLGIPGREAHGRKTLDYWGQQ